MHDKILNQIFKNLDSWRKLPKYQLERRLDIFLTPYLKSILKHNLNIDTSDLIIPEFPINVNLVNTLDVTNKLHYDEKATKQSCLKLLSDNNVKQQSFNIDYLMYSIDNTTVYFIELKTDNSSYNDEQKQRMILARDNYSFNEILYGIKSIYKRTKSKTKYVALIDMLFENPNDFINCDKYDFPFSKIEIIYLLPTLPDKSIAQKNDNISFVNFMDMSNSIIEDNSISKKVKEILKLIYVDYSEKT